MAGLAISVIIPVGPLHGTRFVQAVRSVQLQHGVDFEIIVVDDVIPTPDTESLLDLDLLDQEYVTFVTSGYHNVSKTRNIGAKVAQGQCLVFLDADDFLMPGALLAMWTVHKAKPGSLVYGDIVLGNGTVFRPKIQYCGSNLHKTVLYEPKRFVTHLIPADVFWQVGGFPEDAPQMEDVMLETAIDCLTNTCAVKIDYPIYLYDKDAGGRFAGDDEAVKAAVREYSLAKFDEFYTGARKMGCGCGPATKETPTVMQQGASAMSNQGILQKLQTHDATLVYVGNESVTTRYGPVTGRPYRMGKSTSPRYASKPISQHPKEVRDVRGRVVDHEAVHPDDAAMMIVPTDMRGKVFEIQYSTKATVADVDLPEPQAYVVQQQQRVPQPAPLPKPPRRVAMPPGVQQMEPDSAARFTATPMVQQPPPKQVNVDADPNLRDNVLFSMDIDRFTVAELGDVVDRAPLNVLTKWLAQEQNSNRTRVTVVGMLDKAIARLADAELEDA